MSPAAPATRRIALFCAALLAGSAGLWIATLDGKGALDAPRVLPVWLPALLFGLSEVFVVHVPLRRQAHTLSLRELPLMLGLFFVSPMALVAGQVFGSGAALVLHRRQHGLKLVFNLSLLTSETVVALAMFRAALGPADALGARAWLAGMLAAVSADLLGGVMVTAAMRVSGDPFEREPVLWALLAGVVASVTTTNLGLLAVVLVWLDLRATWVALLVLAATTFGALRSYASLHERFRRLEHLYGFTRVVGRSVHTDSVVAAVLDQARELLRAEHSELVLVSGGGGIARFTLDTGDGLAVDRSDQIDPGDTLWARVVATDEALLVPRSERDERLRAQLLARGFRDVVAAPLRGDAGIVGMMLVANHLGEVGTFGLEDLRLFETLANHASISLENGRLVDELRTEIGEREQRALHDSLTGLPNRAQLVDSLASLCEHAVEAAKIGVLVLGLDRFKEINETLGYDNGDRVLMEVAGRLRSAVREHDVVARLGGDEFAVLLSDIPDAGSIRRKAEELVDAVGRPLTVSGLALDVGASVGLAIHPDHGEAPEVLIQRADVAMYVAKSRHSVLELYEPAPDDAGTRRRLALAHELRNAIERQELVLHYQPQLDLHSGQARGVEALVRWHHPDHGLLPPDEFIPAAEHTGLIRPLTLFVLGRALEQRRAWEEQALDLEVAVNVSARNLADPWFAEKVAVALTKSHCPAEALTLEITESQLMSDPRRAAGALERLHDLGVRISIDDFGTGFSSLSSLRALPLDEIKIDKSFVLNLARNENDAVIVRSLAELGRNLGLRVVAEGVEDESALERLQAFGCDYAQGYYFSKPLPALEVTARLRHWIARGGPGPSAGVFHFPGERPAAG